MTSDHPKPVDRGAHWRSPLDLSHYDRTPHLHPQERVALDRLVALFDRHYGVPRTSASYAALQRLLGPITDVLALRQLPSARTTRATTTLLIREMQRRQTPFWAWAAEEWADLLALHNASPKHQRQRARARHNLATLAYLLCDFRAFATAGDWDYVQLASQIFGKPLVDAAVATMLHELTRWGYGERLSQQTVPKVLCELLLLNRSPHLADLTARAFHTVCERELAGPSKLGVLRMSRVLASLGILPEPIGTYSTGPSHARRFEADAALDVPPDWLAWCQRWYATSTKSRRARKSDYSKLLRVGRWLTQVHPTITSPQHWTCELATEYVAALDRATIGGLAARTRSIPAEKLGKPFTARAKATYLATLRGFFRDCHEWGWLERRFDPTRCLATPRAIRAQIGPSPRVIADDIWAKLVWAGLNLSAADMPGTIWTAGPNAETRTHWYPLAMVRAVVLVWLFAGLRSDELLRLRVGCVRWLVEDEQLESSGQVLTKEAVCWLDVPVNKTSTAFTKPVDRLVGEAITEWEAHRPPQPSMIDPKTGEVVQVLFAYRGRRLGRGYLNRTIIPFLCRKAGVPERDARGNFTSHRARSTIASQLANARAPMSLYEIQEWLGHRSPTSTIHYLRPTPTRLAKVFRDAEYLTRNLRTIAVLIDQAAIRSGAAAAGEPWRYYDLGHGYCTYDFFDQCPHRMACAKCAFYVPKGSSQAQLLEAKTNLGRMLQEIPLSEEERAAVEDGLSAIERLSVQLLDVPTPAGPTPRQLATQVIAEEAITIGRPGSGSLGGGERRGEGGEGGAGEGVGT